MAAWRPEESESWRRLARAVGPVGATGCNERERSRSVRPLVLEPVATRSWVPLRRARWPARAPKKTRATSRGSFRPPNVPLLSCGRIQKPRRHQMATSEPVVHHHGRQAERCRSRRGAAVRFNSLLGGARSVAVLARNRPYSLETIACTTVLGSPTTTFSKSTAFLPKVRTRQACASSFAT